MKRKKNNQDYFTEKTLEYDTKNCHSYFSTAACVCKEGQNTRLNVGGRKEKEGAFQLMTNPLFFILPVFCPITELSEVT